MTGISLTKLVNRAILKQAIHLDLP